MGIMLGLDIRLIVSIRLCIGLSLGQAYSSIVTGAWSWTVIGAGARVGAKIGAGAWGWGLEVCLGWSRGGDVHWGYGSG